MANCRVTAEFLVQGLGLPSGTRIIGATYDSHEYTLTLDVEHHSIPLGTEEVNVVYRTVACHFEPVKGAA